MSAKYITVLCLMACLSGYGQENTGPVTLEYCIETALRNNLDLKSSHLKANTAKVNYRQSRFNILPDANASYNLGVTNGRSIDPYTNSYLDQQLTFSNAGLQLNLTVFNGFRLLNTIRQNRYNLQASEMEVREARQNLVLDVTLAYLQILNNRELLKQAKARMETTEKQLQRLGSLYNEGSGNPADYTDMQGQLALDKTTSIQAENSLKASVLNLYQLLNMEDTPNIAFAGIEPTDTMQQYPLSAKEVLTDALANLATFKAKELRLDAAKNGVKVARAGYIPTISVFGELNTNYSSAAEFLNETGTSIEETGDFVSVDGQDYPVLREETHHVGESISYEDQFNNNLSTAIGLSVNVPLFNGFRARNNVALEKIKMEESRIDLENTGLQLRQAIEQAHLDMQSAFDRYHVLTGQVKAYEESFRVNEVRFNNGVSNIVEYITSKNNMDNARIGLANAKYEYLLRVRVLEYYRGI
ncbi:TolC family protein [Sinomicrobium sp. M5D2P17]